MKAHFFQEGSVRRRNPVFLMMCKFLKAYLAVGFLLRIILMLTTPSDAGLTFGSVFRCLGVGILADFGMGILLTVPLMILYLGFTVGGFPLFVLATVYFLSVWWRRTESGPPLFRLETAEFLFPPFHSTDQNGVAETVSLFCMGCLRVSYVGCCRWRISVLAGIRREIQLHCRGLSCLHA